MVGEPVPNAVVETLATETWWKATPLWVKILVGLMVTGSVPAGVAAMLPFETKDSTAKTHEEMKVEEKKAHDHLQEQIDALKDLPSAVAKELNDQGFLRHK